MIALDVRRGVVSRLEVYGVAQASGVIVVCVLSLSLSVRGNLLTKSGCR
jgi:hypothetical protein